jgi:predicted ATPase
MSSDSNALTDSTFITRVILRNYKSIASCDVKLRSLTYLVGPNGAGKSNFLDALRFVADALNTTLDHAMRDRGGINDVRRRSSGHPTHFGVELHFQDRKGGSGVYAFRIGARPQGGFEVQEERCELKGFFSEDAHYKVEKGVVTSSSIKSPPAAVSDRLYLMNASGIPEFRQIYENLSHMGFYNLNPEHIRDLQSPDAGELLQKDGSNIASVVRQLSKVPELKRRLEEYLSLVVPGIEGFAVKPIGPKETLEFRQTVKGAKHPWFFSAANMSDGTLRALGILVALFQSKSDPNPKVRLIGVEEPEVALHPAAAGILRDSLNEASKTTQVLVTSHSPDLLDDGSISVDSLLAVVSEAGETKIAPLDDAGRSAVRDKLYTPGELLRLNQLVPAAVEEIENSTGAEE